MFSLNPNGGLVAFSAVLYSLWRRGHWPERMWTKCIVYGVSFIQVLCFIVFFPQTNPSCQHDGGENFGATVKAATCVHARSKKSSLF